MKEVKEANVPWAHVRANDMYTWCGDIHGAGPPYFMFVDAQHALKHYGHDNPHFRACASCLDAIRGKG